jgi:hypothetical protein
MEILFPPLRVSKAVHGIGKGLPIRHDAILTVRIRPARQIAGFLCPP